VRDVSTPSTTRARVGTALAANAGPAPARLLQRRCACGQHTGGGECASCRDGATAAHADSRAIPASDFGRVQARAAVTLGDAGSRHEAEADRFADQVGRSLEAKGPKGRPVPATSGGQSRDSLARRGEDDGGPAPVQPAGDSGLVGRPVSEPLQRDLEASQGRGRQLPEPTRQTLQPYFGGDLGGVRVHDDSDAHRMADDLGAQAFALGGDVYFGQGRFAPDSADGRDLLLHELAHTEQQGALAASVVRSKPKAAAQAFLTIRSITVYPDTKIVVMGLSDGSSRSYATTMTGTPIPGTYQATIDDQGVVTIVGNKSTGASFDWQRDRDIAIDTSHPYWLVIAQGTPGQGKPGGQGATGGAPPDKQTTPPPAGQAKDRPGTGTTPSPAPAKDKPGKTPDPDKPATDPNAPATTPSDAEAKLKALPEAIKAIMGGDKSFKPQDYDKLLKIAKKLEGLDSRDLELYKFLATKATMDLDSLDRSIDVFLQVKEQIRQQIVAAEEQKKKEKDKEPTLESQIEQTWSGFDEKKFAGMDSDQKEALARQIAAEQRNLQLKHMVTHPGETAAGMVEGVVRPDKVASDVIDDIKEAADGDKSGFARGAAASGAIGKTAGYVAAVLGVLYVALLFIPGVNLVELGLTIMVAGAIAITATAVEADLRIKAAGAAKDPKDFKEQTQKAATAQASFFVQAALLALHLVAKLIAKIPIGGQMKTVGGALKVARAKLLNVTGVGPAFEGIRAEVLESLKKAKAGLRDALGREAKPLADTASRVRTMTGREFLKAVADGDPALQEASGMTPDMANQTLALADVPETSNVPEQVRGQVLKGLEDAPVEAGRQVDSFINDVDQSISSAKQASTPAELDAAAAIAEEVLSPEEAAKKLNAGREGYVKGRLEDAAADDRPVSKGKPIKTSPPPADAAPKTGETKAPVKPDEAKAPAKTDEAKQPGKSQRSPTPDPTEKEPMEAVERTDIETLKKERAATEAALKEARAELEEVSKRRADLDRAANEAQRSIEQLERERSSAKSPEERATTDERIKQARRARKAATDARQDVPTDREMTPTRNKIERLQGRLEQLDTVLDPKSTRAPLPCFAAGTPVWTLNGPRAIEAIGEGDRVLAYDLVRQAVVERPVARVHRNRTRHFYEVAVSGRVVGATGRHPFWSEGTADWVAAAGLTPDSSLKSLDGRPAAVESVTHREGGESDTFNLTVEGVHNYFVGPGVLVHNGSPVDLGLGDEFIYIGTNPKFPNKVYVGKSNKMKRQAQHRAEAQKELKRTDLTPEEREFFEFKSEMTIEPVVEGVGGDVTPYLEQKNLELEIRNRTDANVLYRRNERTPEKMAALKERIAKDPKVQELGYCPKG
jgi:hypothetical protein